MERPGLKSRIRRRLKRFAVVLNRVQLPGMAGVGLYSALKFFWHNLQESDITIRASGMAFRFFFALFPSLIFLFILIPLIPVEGLSFEMTLFLNSVFPPNSFDLVESVVKDFFDNPGVGLISINIILLVYSATGGIKAMINAFFSDNEVLVKKTFLHLNLSALLIFFLLSGLIVALFTLLFLGQYGIHYLELNNMIQGGFALFMLRVLHFLLLVFGMILAISTIYYFGPKTKKSWGFISPGSVIGSVLMMLAMVVFRFFVNSLADYNKIYGSISAIMVIMIWFYWISLVLLIGFEFNRAIARALKWKEE